MELQYLSSVVQYGAVGLVAIALVVITWAIKYLTDANSRNQGILTTIISNHIDHQTTSNRDLTVAIKELSTVIRERIK